jgi:hypothetical protein
MLFLSNISSVIDTMLSGPPFQNHYYSENLVTPGIEPGTCGCAARNFDYYTTEAVLN